jgi:prevent-host-death family protein
MYISIAEAQGQLLELVRRVESGEEVLLTHEGKTVGQISPVRRRQSPEERRRIIREIVEKHPYKQDGGPDAAHSQDFLYDEDGLPA